MSTNTTSNNNLGKKEQARIAGFEAEQRAKQYLIDQNLCFVEQNYSVPLGEIDLIFKQANQLVFVEVKYRSSNSHGKAAEYFTPNKRRKMHRAIMCYLQQHNLNLHHTSLRIDIVAIDNEQLEWLINV